MEVKQDSLEVAIDRNRSIEELAELSLEGTSVLRTCHVGNLSAHNMTLLNEGIPAWLVDYMKVGTDITYLPENIMRAGEVVSLDVTPGAIVSRALVGKDAELDELHMESIRTAFANARVETANGYLARHEDLAQEIIEITGDKERPEDAGIDSYEIGTEGMLLITFIAEALATQKENQFHLGGSLLHKYIDHLIPSLNHKIGLLKRHGSFGADLPERIKVSVVPTEHAVFATSLDKKQEMEELVAAVTTFFGVNERIRENRRLFFNEARTEEERAAFVGQADAEQDQSHVSLRAVVAEHGEIIEDRSSGKWVTQYDVLDSGGFFVHPVNRELTMAQLQKFNEAIIKARQQISCR